MFLIKKKVYSQTQSTLIDSQFSFKLPNIVKEEKTNQPTTFLYKLFF